MKKTLTTLLCSAVVFTSFFCGEKVCGMDPSLVPFSGPSMDSGLVVSRGPSAQKFRLAPRTPIFAVPRPHVLRLDENPEDFEMARRSGWRTYRLFDPLARMVDYGMARFGGDSGFILCGVGPDGWFQLYLSQ